MLEAITIKGFRKYKQLNIDGFDMVNVILGDNNIGKTTILEGIYAWACGQNIVPFLSIPLARGRYSFNQQQYWLMEEILSVVNDRYELPLHMEFIGCENGKEVEFIHDIEPSEILAQYDSTYKKKFTEMFVPASNSDALNERHYINSIQGLLGQIPPTIVAKWKITNDDNSVITEITSPSTATATRKPYRIAKFIDLLSHTAVTETVQIYGILKRELLLDEVTRKMREIYPEIIGFDSIPYPDGSQTPVSVLRSDGKYLPLYTFGDGLQRWFYIIGSLILYKNSIICIDEIDSGIHPKAQALFCKNLMKYAKDNNVQLFITTHNIEFIDAFLESGEEEGDKARIITLKDNDGDIKIRNLNFVEARKARDKYGVELR